MFFQLLVSKKVCVGAGSKDEYVVSLLSCSCYYFIFCSNDLFQIGDPDADIFTTLKCFS
jgi:hypothetical protein